MPKPAPSPQAFDLMPYNPDLRVVRAVEITKVGTWNDIEFTVADLDEMVAAFNSRLFSVPLKIGHGEVDGLPAYGWVDRIYRQGDTLVADFADVPSWIFDMVFIQHQYDHVSIEVFFNLKANGKTYKRVLKAVALLGAETPAVSGLTPLRDAIFAPGADQYERQIALSLKVQQPMPTPAQTTQPQPQPSPQPAPSNGVSVEAFTALQTQMAQLASANTELVASLKKREDRETELLAQVATLSSARADDAVTTKVASIKVPAVQEHFRHLFSLCGLGSTSPRIVKFKATDGKETDRTLESVLDELAGQFNKLTDNVTQPRFHGRGSAPGTNGARQPSPTSSFGLSPDVELDQAVKAHMAEKGLKPSAENYQAASRAVMATNPELRDRYAAFTRGETIN